MVTLRRVGVVSAGRIGFWMGVAFALINFSVFLLLIIFLGKVSIQDIPVDFWVRALLLTGFAGLQASFMWGMVAFIYNMAARNGGGLELDFDMPGSSVSSDNKRKNDDAGETDDNPQIV